MISFFKKPEPTPEAKKLTPYEQGAVDALQGMSGYLLVACQFAEGSVQNKLMMLRAAVDAMVEERLK